MILALMIVLSIHPLYAVGATMMGALIAVPLSDMVEEWGQKENIDDSR